MKKLLVLTMVLVSFVSYGQTKQHFFTPKISETKIKFGIFNTRMKSGTDIETPVKFFVSNVDEVKSSNVYKNFVKETSTDKEYISKWNKNGLDMFGIFLLSNTQICSLAKYEFKNKTSFTPIKDSEGSVTVMSPDEISFSFKCQAQNGYGNMVYHTVYYVVKNVDGKEVTETIVSSN